MTKDTSPRKAIPYGLLELDAVGTVLYFKGDDEARAGVTEVVGRNFFTEVAPAAQADELRAVIKSFWDSHAPSRSLTLSPGDAGLPCKVLLARVHEQKDGWGRDSILVRFKKD